MKTRGELVAELNGVLATCRHLVEELTAREAGHVGSPTIARLLCEELGRARGAAEALRSLECQAAPRPDVQTHG